MACRILSESCGHDSEKLIEALADQLDRIVEQQDACIDVSANGVYEGQQRTRDCAVLECQAWSLAFADEGLEFGAAQGWTGSRLALVDFLLERYPFKVRGDPIPGWQRQARNLRSKRNSHAALTHYNSFVSSTADVRLASERSAAAAEAEIDAAVERARGN